MWGDALIPVLTRAFPNARANTQKKKIQELLFGLKKKLGQSKHPFPRKCLRTTELCNNLSLPPKETLDKKKNNKKNTADVVEKRSTDRDEGRDTVNARCLRRGRKPRAARNLLRTEVRGDFLREKVSRRSFPVYANTVNSRAEGNAGLSGRNVH